ncbi:2OG-Fe(II) oxygenase [Ferrovum myxofaciens]|jgi:Rps23 Pro-64 3,4-dihydroxylase Tpa1-like proline 4-hydroxylase|nr:2OG-Fe(II) oxygenase [Ferrovum myxofaciens]
MFQWIAKDILDANVDRLQDSFQKAHPFRHLVIDELVEKDSLIPLLKAFPESSWSGWENVSHEHQHLKQVCNDISIIPDPLRTLIYELNSGPFLNWLSKVTGIPQILPDPHLFGGGLHSTGPGGTLTPHTDFHVVKGLPLFRRLNLLFYLNSDWTEENGGMLELWHKNQDRIEKIVLPTLGTCVLFQTDNDSMHGFTTPVSSKNRQSVAIYYYTASDAEQFSGDGVTYWRSQSAANDSSSWLRLQAQRTLLFGARVASGLSWRFGMMAEKTRK